MSRLLRHRGPDDEGFLLVERGMASAFGGADTPSDVLIGSPNRAPVSRLEHSFRTNGGGIGLVHRRLSIVDLSINGHQPMSYKGRYWIVFNGEVYNYLELREELKQLGHEFIGGSDTEVILAAYDQWGPECLSRFNGMWGLAILDLQRKTLFLARDRFGVKPLYYRMAAERLSFASEIKAFSGLNDWRPKANSARLLDFLIWNVSDHTRETMFEDVQQLLPGHYMVLKVHGLMEGTQALSPSEVHPERWYDLPESGGSAPGDAVTPLRAILEDAVRLRLRADVQVGSCLSGGIDSATIVCLMGAELARSRIAGTLNTFTATSDDPDFDESRFARIVAAASGAQGHFVTPQPSCLLDELGRLAWHQDEPFASSSTFAQWCVFQEARKNGVKVMLDGQGADEILCGYRGFFGAYLAGLVRRRKFAAWSQELIAIRKTTGFSLTRSSGYTLAYLCPALLPLLGYFDNRAYSDREWISAARRGAFDVDPVRMLGGRPSSVREMSVSQIVATNLPMLLRWEDRNSMASSVEARVPFLDYRVVELCLSLTDSQKLASGCSKAALRQAMRGTVPDPILDRHDKMGFLTAEPTWMKGHLAARFRTALEKALDPLATFVDPIVLRRFDEMASGRRPFDYRYFRIISAGVWADQFSVEMS